MIKINLDKQYVNHIDRKKRPCKGLKAIRNIAIFTAGAIVGHFGVPFVKDCYNAEKQYFQEVYDMASPYYTAAIANTNPEDKKYFAKKGLEIIDEFHDTIWRDPITLASTKKIDELEKKLKEFIGEKN